jgi:chaperone required for assembly of F1-ATPase
VTPAGTDAARRFYKVASCGPEDGGHAVKLDGRTPRTPAGSRLVLPTPTQAALVAAEWEAQGEHILPAAMPASRLAFTAIDRVSQTRAEVAAQVADYACNDLLCYFAEAPAALVQRETEQWGPLLDWAREEIGLPLVTASGVVHRPQPSQVGQTVEALCLAENDFALTALAHATALLGSAVLALALRRGRLDGEQAFALSQLDEIFQAEQWGDDDEAVERRQNLLAETVLLDRWFEALDA